MMMVANAVITGHHCGSFQSVQKSQSPANSCLVMSAAPPTTKIAVTQNTRSHLRSIHLYRLLSSARSSSRRWRSPAVVVPAAIFKTASVRHGLRARGRLPRGILFRLFDFEQAQDGLTPYRNHPGCQPSIHDERPMERHREELLGNPEAVAPLVERDFHALEHRGGDQEKERPREAQNRGVQSWNAIPPVQVSAQSK